MNLDKKQVEAISKSFVTISTYALTAVPLGFFVSSKDIPFWVYLGTVIFGITLWIAGIYLSKEEKKEAKDDKTIKADIKKGVFHIDNATINNNQKEA